MNPNRNTPIKNEANNARQASHGIDCYTNQISANDRNVAIHALRTMADAAEQQENQYQATIQALNLTVARRDATITRLNQTVGRHEGTIRNLETETSDLRNAGAVKDEEILELKDA